MDEQWRDITAVGSSYEVQIEVRTGKQRHRPLSMGRLRQMEHRGFGESDAAPPDIEWSRGSPPDSTETAKAAPAPSIAAIAQDCGFTAHYDQTHLHVSYFSCTQNQLYSFVERILAGLK